jgi:hypothetical protein
MDAESSYIQHGLASLGFETEKRVSSLGWNEQEKQAYDCHSFVTLF